jgi:hypothetical protein
MSYAWEKFHLAIDCLAGAGSQRERLVGAYVSNLIRLNAEDLPIEIQDEFRKLQRDITRQDATGSEGTVQATVNTMDDGEVASMVKNILSMHDTVTRHQGPM